MVTFTFEVLGNMFIAIVWKPGCNVMNFEVNLDQKVVWKT